MARSYRVARPSTGAGKADVLFAGGGRRGAPKIPQGTPRFRVDMNWEEAQEKTAHQARVRALAAAGYDPKILADMSPEALARIHAQMADDPLEAAKEKKASDLTQEEGSALAGLLEMYQEGRRKFPQESPIPSLTEDATEEEAKVPSREGKYTKEQNDKYIRGFEKFFGEMPKDLHSENLLNTIVDEPDPAEMPEGIFDASPPQADVGAELARVQGDPASPFSEGEEEPTQPPLTRARELIGMFGELDPINQEKLFPEFLAAMTKFTEPLKEVDEWKKSWFAFETSDDGKTQWRITYTKEGKELAKTKMPPNVTWQGVRIYKDGKPGYMHVNKNNPYEWHEDGKGNRIFIPLPEGAKFKADRVAGKNNPKFTAWLMNHKTHKNLLPFMKGKGAKGYTVGFNDWLVGADTAKRKAAMEFSKTSSGLEMLIDLAIQNAGGVKEGTSEFEQEKLKRGMVD